MHACVYIYTYIMVIYKYAVCAIYVCQHILCMHGCTHVHISILEQIGYNLDRPHKKRYIPHIYLLQDGCICRCIKIYVCIHVDTVGRLYTMCIHIYIYVYSASLCEYVMCLHACTCVHTYTCMRAHVLICMCIYVRIYTYVYTSNCSGHRSVASQG